MKTSADQAVLSAASPQAVERFGLEQRFDPEFVARLAIREKQIQQNYRPIVGIHKWFARRPGSVFRSLLLSEFIDAPIDQSFWQSNNASGVIADPFMGGGTTVFEALRLGMSIVGTDINPMSYWLVRQAVEPIDVDEFKKVGTLVWRDVLKELHELYSTSCENCHEQAAVKYFLWVKTCSCPACGDTVSLFPGYRVAEAVRHPRSVYHCPVCDRLLEFETGADPVCTECMLDLGSGNVSRGTARCTSCQHEFPFAPALAAPPEHRLFAIEYQCSTCYPTLIGRQFKAPDPADDAKVDSATEHLRRVESILEIPGDAVPNGDETARLHRWGYNRYRDLFNDRQLLSLGLLQNAIRLVNDERVRHALATVFSDFLRYQNLLCRYDTYALKCQDIFSLHGFPVGLIACENNVLGIPRVGSGSFIHFVDKYAKAKDYAQNPYETSNGTGKKKRIHTFEEKIEAPLIFEEPTPANRSAWLTCGPSQDLALRPNSLDGVFTDPPYFDNVQYAELMDFCFVWLRQLLDEDDSSFERASTRTQKELTGNNTLDRALEEFSAGLTEVFCRMSEAMKPGAPLVFTYHHNDALAYAPLVISILNAELTCTAVLPAPAEMAASRHIVGTKSSILDSVFICRDQSWVAAHAKETPAVLECLDERVVMDVSAMSRADYTCTDGDIACLRAGHVAMDAVRDLATDWDPDRSLAVQLKTVHEHMAARTSDDPLGELERKTPC